MRRGNTLFSDWISAIHIQASTLDVKLPRAARDVSAFYRPECRA
jgi:hypothetical protein